MRLRASWLLFVPFTIICTDSAVQLSSLAMGQRAKEREGRLSGSSGMDSLQSSNALKVTTNGMPGGEGMTKHEPALIESVERERKEKVGESVGILKEKLPMKTEGFVKEVVVREKKSMPMAKLRMREERKRN